MFKFLLELALILIFGIFIITQVIIPVVANIIGFDLDLFWMFKKKTPTPPTGDVEQLVHEIKQSAELHKTSVKKVDSAIEALTEAKKTN